MYSLDRENWSVKAPRVKDAGTYTVYYKSFGDENREDSEIGKLTVKIAPKPLDVVADQKEKFVGDSDPELTYRSDSLEYGDEMTGKLTRDKGEKVGKYRIKLGTLSAGKNYDIHFTENWLIIRDRVTPKPTAKPFITPDPSAEPHKTTRPTARPTATSKPFITPDPSAEPHKTARPTAKPTATAKPTVTPKPTATPKPTTAPAQSDFTLLARLDSSESDDTTLKLSWTKVNGADGYDVFLGKGIDGTLELYKSVDASESKLRFTGLEKGEIYKACVKAWKREKGEESFIGDTSPLVFAITGGYNARYCDPASVIVNVKRVVLKNGGSYRIRATLKGCAGRHGHPERHERSALLQQQHQRGDGERNRKD